MSFDTKTIEEKIANVKMNFDLIQGKIKKIELEEGRLAQEKAELNVELFRFQGEHRVLESLKPKEAVVEPPKEEAKK